MQAVWLQNACSYILLFITPLLIVLFKSPNSLEIFFQGFVFVFCFCILVHQFPTELLILQSKIFIKYFLCHCHLQLHSAIVMDLDPFLLLSVNNTPFVFYDVFTSNSILSDIKMLCLSFSLHVSHIYNLLSLYFHLCALLSVSQIG